MSFTFLVVWLTGAWLSLNSLADEAPPPPDGQKICPLELPAPYLDDQQADGRLVVIFKRQFRLGFYQGGRLVNDEAGRPICFQIAMGPNPSIAKKERDRQSTPEGWYRVVRKLERGQTAFYRALLVDYPNEADADQAFAQGLIDQATRQQIIKAQKANQLPPQETAMGGWIEIHGHGSFPPNWTLGCVALNDPEIDELFPRVRVGDRVLFIPWTTSLP